MSSGKIVYMANQIATFFESQPPVGAAAGVANHINKFWSVPMRRQFFALLTDANAGFEPLVIEAAPSVNRPDPQPAADSHGAA